LKHSQTDERTLEADKNLSLFRLLTPSVIADPTSFYRELRERDPVHWDPYVHAWVVTSYPEVVTVLNEYSADRTPAPDHLDRSGLSILTPFAEMMLRQMMFMDGEMHTRLRGLCAAAFTPRRVQKMHEVIVSVADKLLDSVIASGRMDLVADFANPLPAIITAKMLDLPVEDYRQVGAWVIDIAEMLGNVQHHPDRVAQSVQSLDNLKNYVAAKMGEQRSSPTDGFIHSLMNAEVNGARLTDDEVIANTIITLIGGHETTTNLIASGFIALLDRPECFEQLRKHPEIVKSAVEELLRFVSPVQHTARIAPSDMLLGGKTIRKGSKVVAVLAAANRDPARFPDSDNLDLCRPNNKHLAFGWASHFCFGAPLARMEGQVAFNALLRRISNPMLLDKNLDWRTNAGLRGLTMMNISFEPALPRA
jgi:pimeloyl-[acyl-carrier protein] synthase